MEDWESDPRPKTLLVAGTIVTVIPEALLVPMLAMLWLRIPGLPKRASYHGDALMSFLQ